MATAPGRGGIAVVRVSGPEAFRILKALTGREAQAGRIAFAAMRDAGGNLLDRGVVLAFGRPHSYTGEDVVEFQCHGGSVTPGRILDATVAAGARLAQRGEFTKRAFLNGRLGLSEAEAVIELVDSQTARAADDALRRLDGAQEARLRRLYDSALSVSGDLEHALDIDEGELPPSFCEEKGAAIAELRRQVAELLRRAAEGRILRHGALVVLSGPPNAGKSSLMNALLGEARAIVSDTPGTTRDSIEELLDVGGWPIRLVDTAGLRDADEPIEAEGVRRARELVERADLRLALEDAAGDERTIVVRTKCDLPETPRYAAAGAISVSAATGEGLDVLRREIASRLAALSSKVEEGEATPSEREREALTGVGRALEGADCGDLVLTANAVRSAAEILGALVGATYSSDLLDAIFSRFCVGK